MFRSAYYQEIPISLFFSWNFGWNLDFVDDTEIFLFIKLFYAYPAFHYVWHFQVMRERGVYVSLFTFSVI